MKFKKMRKMLAICMSVAMFVELIPAAFTAQASAGGTEGSETYVPLTELDFRDDIVEESWSVLNSSANVNNTGVLRLKSSSNVNGIKHATVFDNVNGTLEIAFRARVNSWTQGPDANANTLGLNIGLGNTGMEISVEQSGLRYVTSAGTWSETIAYTKVNPADADFHMYKILIDTTKGTDDGAVSIEVDHVVQIADGNILNSSDSNDSGIEIWTVGSAENSGNVDIDWIKANDVDTTFKQSYEEDGWTVLGSSEETELEEENFVNLSDAEGIAKKMQGVVSEQFSTYAKYCVEFSARLNSSNWTAGSTQTNLGLQLYLGAKRFMFALDSTQIKTSTTAGTWKNQISHADGFDVSQWHTYKLVGYADSTTIDIYVDGIKVGSGSLQTNSNQRRLEFWVQGTKALPVNADIGHINLGYYESTESNEMILLSQETFDDTKLSNYDGATLYQDGMLHIESEGAVNEIKNASAVSSTESSLLEIEFAARVNSWTEGPSNSQSTLAIKGQFGDSRVMFAIEEAGLYYSTSSGIWSGNVAYQGGVNPADGKFHTYKIVIDRRQGALVNGAVSVSIDGVLQFSDGAIHNTSGPGGAGLSIFSQGTATYAGNADVDWIKMVDVTDTSNPVVKVENTFNDSSEDNGWVLSPASGISQIEDHALINLYDADGFARSINKKIDLSSYEKYSVEFSARLNTSNWTAGAGNQTNLGFNMYLGSKRFMFSLDSTNIVTSTTAGTWKNKIAHVAGFDVSQWHTYKLVGYSDSTTVDIYVDGEKVGSGSLQSTTAQNSMQFWVQGTAALPASADIRTVSVGYYYADGHPYWSSDAVLQTTPLTNGMQLSWPEAQDMDEESYYNVYVDGAKVAEGITAHEYQVKDLTRMLDVNDIGYRFEIEAVNSNGASNDKIFAIDNCVYDFASNTMDIKTLVEGTANGADSEYQRYRIPGMVVTKNDTVLVYYEARTANDDWSPSDIVLYRSEDRGETFGEPIMLALGVDIDTVIHNPVIMVGDDNTLHFIYSHQYGLCYECEDSVGTTGLECTHEGPGIYYRSSTDDGKTWSEPKDITSATNPDERYVFCAGPGHGTQLSNGTLIVPIWMVLKEDVDTIYTHIPSVVSTLYSVDNGETWQLGDIVPNENGYYSPNETALVELSDGRVMLNSRIHNGGYRALAISENGYSNWSSLEYDYTLIDPTCFGSMVKYDVADDPYTILFVNCESQAGRQKLTVKGSTDDGENWNLRRVVEWGTAGYSDIATDSQGGIYVLYETNTGATCNLARFSYDYLNETEVDRAPNLTEEGLYASDLSQNLTWSSTSYSTGAGAATAFDGNIETRWCARGKAFPQALMVDLGEEKEISQVNIFFEQESEWEYQLLISDDGIKWELYGENEETIPKQQNYNIVKDAKARYVAIVMESAGLDANGGQCWASIWEMEVIEKDTGTNLALNQPCAATSNNSVGGSAAAAFDNDYSTRYCAKDNSMPQQLTVDLGDQYDIGAVYVNFEQVSEWNCVIETSKDGIVWETFAEPFVENAYQTLQKDTAEGRYVRLTVNGTSGTAWASVYEMKVYTTEPVVSPFERCHVEEPITQDENGAKIEFRGGSLRMDYEDYDKTSLRFGYKITLPEGATLKRWSWKYTAANPDKILYCQGEKSTVNEDGTINANLVMTRVPKSYFGLVLTTKMKIVYTLSDGTECTLEEDVFRSRSVTQVAENILASPDAPQVDVDYATNLLR